MSEKKSFLKEKKAIPFLDLFAGAGGIISSPQLLTRNKTYVR